MTEQNNLNNDDNYQSFNNPQKYQYNYLFVSEQPNQNEYNIENNIPFSNEHLNAQFLSGKRRKLQIIFSIILYILGLLLLLLILFINYKEKYFFFVYSSFLFIASILDIILASINVYYTKIYQNSRNICASLISGFLFFILLFTFFYSIKLFFLCDYQCRIIAEIIIIIIIIFINIIFSIILFFFNSKSKCCKCFN